jgi:chaperonin GroES
MEKLMNLKPLQDRVIIRQSQPELTTSFGLVLIDTPSKHENEGTIVALGRGRLNKNDKIMPMDVKVGDRVLYLDSDDLVKFRHDGVEYVTVREDHIAGVLE